MRKTALIILLILNCICLFSVSAAEMEIDSLCRYIINDSIHTDIRVSEAITGGNNAMSSGKYVTLAAILEAVSFNKDVRSNGLIAKIAPEWSDFIYEKALGKVKSDNVAESTAALGALSVLGNSPFCEPTKSINANIVLANMAYNDENADAMGNYVHAADSVAALMPSSERLATALTQLHERYKTLSYTSAALKQRLSGLWYSTDFCGLLPALELSIDGDEAWVKETIDTEIPFGTAIKNKEGEWYLPDAVSKKTVCSPSQKEITYVFGFDSDNPGSPRTAMFMSIFAEQASGTLTRSMAYKQSKSKKYNYGAALTSFGGEALGIIMQGLAKKWSIKTSLAGVVTIRLREIVPGVAKAIVSTDIKAQNSEGTKQDNKNHIEINLFKVDKSHPEYGFAGNGMMPKKFSYDFENGKIKYGQANFSINEIYYEYPREGEQKLPEKRKKESIDSLINVYSALFDPAEMDEIEKTASRYSHVDGWDKKRDIINACKFKLLHRESMARLNPADTIGLSADDRDIVNRTMKLSLTGEDRTDTPITITLDNYTDQAEFTGDYFMKIKNGYVSYMNPRHYLDIRKKFSTTVMEQNPSEYFCFMRKENRELRYTENVLPIKGRAEWYTYPKKKEIIHTYTGTFKDRKFDGEGTLTEGGREIYTGGWKEGKYHGRGRLNVYDKYGNFVRTDEGVFEKGKLITDKK